MSKLTDTLISQLPGHLKNMSIKFNSDLLDQDLVNKLSIYLSTKSSRKLVEFSFALASARRLDVHLSIIEQIRYKPAQQLTEIISQETQSKLGKLQRAYVPRWMVLILASEMYVINGKAPTTAEDAINIVFRLCIDLLDKSLGYDGQVTKKVS